MSIPETEQAKRLLARLVANADAFCADQLPYEAFAAQNRATWDAIHAAGPTVTRRVLKSLRNESA